MSNNIKKFLVMLSLAVFCVSGLAESQPEPPKQHCSTPGCTSMQKDHATNNQMPNKPQIPPDQKLKHHNDNPYGPMTHPH